MACSRIHLIGVTFAVLPIMAVSLTEEGTELFKVVASASFQRLEEVDHTFYAGLEALIEEAGLDPQAVWDIYFH